MENQKTPNLRIVDIANKLFLKENKYIRDQLKGWIDQSKDYANMMVEKYGFNNVQKTVKGYQVLFLMNKICPNLHHFHNRPNFKPYDKDSLNEYNDMKMKRSLENTQVGVVVDGTLVQEGVHYTDEEYDAFMEIAERVLEKEPSALETMKALGTSSEKVADERTQQKDQER